MEGSKGCDEEEHACATASVRPWEGRTEPKERGIQSI